MAEKVFEYTEDERRLLRQSKALGELVEHPGWKQLLGIVSAWIEYRQGMVEKPIYSNGGDLMSHVVQIEGLKGAIYGMRMVCSLPELTIQAAKDMAKEKPQTQAEKIP